MIDFVYSSGSLIAIFIERNFSPRKTEFFTPVEEPMQLGVGVYSKGSFVGPHTHSGLPTQVTEYQEFVFLRKGSAITEVFGKEGEFLKRYQMNEGDLLLLFRGGHSFHFLEETELLEVKQGPYGGRELMKQMLSVANQETDSNL